jgi:hypothetical protein
LPVQHSSLEPPHGKASKMFHSSITNIYGAIYCRFWTGASRDGGETGHVEIYNSTVILSHTR